MATLTGKIVNPDHTDAASFQFSIVRTSDPGNISRRQISVTTNGTGEFIVSNLVVGEYALVMGQDRIKFKIGSATSYTLLEATRL